MSKADKAKARKRRKQVWVPGRNRKDGGRVPSGDIKKPRPSETIDQVLAVAKNNPDRRGRADPLARYHGWELGRRFLSGEIDAAQFDAAEKYIEHRARWLAAITSQKETAQALDMAKEPTARGLWAVALDDADQDAANRAARAAWDKIIDTLADHSRVLFGGKSDNILAKTVWDAAVLNHVRDIGEVRQALNVLSRLWGNRPVAIW